MVKAALQKGIDCVAICDHGEIRGALEALEFATNLPILIIPGIEIKSKEGDILGLNLKSIISNGLSAEKTIEEIKRVGGKAIIPHPFGFNCAFRGDLKKIMNIIDGIEVLNASLFGSGNKKALALAEKYRLPMSAGSDAHSPAFVGRAYVEIPGKNLSVEEVFLDIKNRNIKIRGGEANFLEKVVDHSLRNIIRVKNYASRKKRTI